MNPNILLITTDQQRFDTIHALGNQIIRTPHLDLLAREGIAFTRAYADCPMCIPARWTIMGGQRAATFGHAYYEDRVPLAVDPAKTVPGLLSRAGYQTQAMGKMHFWPLRARYGFDNTRILDDYYRHMAQHPEYGLPMRHGLGQNEFYPTSATVHESRTLTAWTVDQSIDFLETRDPTAPFFLWTSFSKPHPPFDPPAPYDTMYQGKAMPQPVQGDWLQRLHDTTGSSWDNRVHGDDAITGDTRDDALRAYYGLITQIDYNLGRLFARMYELKLWDNTMILFTSDHGEMLGDHCGFGKGSYFEGSAHVPFIIKPIKDSMAPAAKFIDTPVTHSDILPTIISQVQDGAAILSGVQTDGINVLGTIDRECIQGEWAHTRHFITDGRFKYLYHLNGGVELLFDLESDPREEHDLSQAPGFQLDCARLRQALCDRLQAVGIKTCRMARLYPHLSSH